ncbi:MAG: TolC family protein [Verrucomicrobiae bacterium]|nr:TolC family protein [Verrucomicrobiae bacterium]
MKTRIIKLLLAASLLLPAAARAQDALDGWIATALQKNPQLLAAKKRWEAAKHKIPQARAFEDPQIGVDVERSGTTRFDTFSDNEWMISQKLPWFGKRDARGKVASFDAEGMGFQYIETLREVRARVTMAYWNLWLAQKAVEVNSESKLLLQQFEETSRVRYETGQASQSDVLRAQMERAKLENELVSLEREVSVAQSAVNTLLNVPTNTPRHVDMDAALPPLDLSLDSMTASARQYSPRLQAYVRSIKAKEASVRVAKQAYAPDFEFRVEARQFNGKSGIQEYDTGVFLNFPWLWHGKYDAGVREAKADMEAAQAEYDSTWNQIVFELKEMQTRADAAQRQMKLFETTVLPQAKQTIEATRASYQVNRATLLELIDAQRTLKQFQLDYYRARADYAKNAAQLQQIVAPFGDAEMATGLVKSKKVKP